MKHKDNPAIQQFERVLRRYLEDEVERLRIEISLLEAIQAKLSEAMEMEVGE